MLQNEILQYKGQLEQLSQLSERLVASYPNDDTSRVVHTNETMIQRYSALNAG